MSDSSGLSPAVQEVVSVGWCRHPVRLKVEAADRATGELGHRSFLVACKDRREVLCPACAETYRADAFWIVSAGLRGGKGVPVSVATHPACFVTLTAPSFGPVHTRPGGDLGGPCRPRRTTPVCPHGLAMSCRIHHGPDDPVLGRPLCSLCFDYEGAVLWNARMSLLWQRTSVAIARNLARTGGVARASAPAAFRCSYVKVVEFQRRGLVHLHVVMRADGPEGPGDPPPGWLDGAVLKSAVEGAATRVGLHPLEALIGLTGPVAWGTERTVRALSGGDHEKVASYLAKYAVKAATKDPVLTHRPKKDRPPVVRGVDAHVAGLVGTAWRLGDTAALRDLRLRDHAHTFGYGGHFATKSRLWSTTFSALRGVRADFARKSAPEDAGAQLVEGTWRYSGRGYRAKGADRLAEVLAEGITGRPHRVPTGPPGVPRGVPRAQDQGR